MGIVDIVILVFLILAVLIGFFKGFKRKHLYSFASTLGCAVGYLCGIPLARSLRGTSFGNITLTNAYRKTRPESGIFAESVSLSQSERAEQLHTALSEIKVPSFFQGFAINHVMDLSGSVSKALASSFSYRTLILGCFILLFLLVRLIAFLLRPLWNGLFGENGTSIIGRLFGRIYSLAKMSIFLLGARRIRALINQLRIRFGATSRNDFLVSDLKLDNNDAFSIGKLFYDTANSFRQWISLIG